MLKSVYVSNLIERYVTNYETLPKDNNENDEEDSDDNEKAKDSNDYKY